jgi:hypothetical protein
MDASPVLKRNGSNSVIRQLNSVLARHAAMLNGGSSRPHVDALHGEQMTGCVPATATRRKPATSNRAAARLVDEIQPDRMRRL